MLLQQINQEIPCKAANSTRFFLVRHGESQANKERFLAGQTLDVDLTAKGEEEAHSIGKQLSCYPLHSAFSSPRIRTRKTAQIILSELACPLSIQEDALLLERHSGKFEGKAMGDEYLEMKKRGEAEIEKLSSFEEKFSFKFDKNDPLEESQRDVFERLATFLKEKHRDSSTQGQNILVTTHNGVMKALFMHDVAVHYQKEAPYHLFALSNCGLMILDFRDEDSHLVHVQGVTYYSPPPPKDNLALPH